MLTQRTQGAFFFKKMRHLMLSENAIIKRLSEITTTINQTNKINFKAKHIFKIEGSPILSLFRHCSCALPFSRIPIFRK